MYGIEVGNVIIHEGYKYRIRPSDEQKTLIHKTTGSCRYIWNRSLGNQKKKGQKVSLKLYIV